MAVEGSLLYGWCSRPVQTLGVPLKVRLSFTHDFLFGANPLWDGAAKGNLSGRNRSAAGRPTGKQFKQRTPAQNRWVARERQQRMNRNDTSNFKATALNDETLRTQAPSIFACGPMQGVSPKYTFVPTAELVAGLREHDWVPVNVEEQRIRNEARRGFQKHLIRFRRTEQMQTLDEWNVELVLVNSHDRGCAYQLHAGIFRRICSNGLVLSLC